LWIIKGLSKHSFILYLFLGSHGVPVGGIIAVKEILTVRKLMFPQTILH
jgi:hypothetical protein